jgi:hypothetical protein
LAKIKGKMMKKMPQHAADTPMAPPPPKFNGLMHSLSVEQLTGEDPSSLADTILGFRGENCEELGRDDMWHVNNTCL